MQDGTTSGPNNWPDPWNGHRNHLGILDVVPGRPVMFTSEPTPEQLLDLSQGAKLSALQQPLNEDLDTLRKQVYNKIFTAISKGELTSEMAVQAWHEVHAYHRIQQKINQRVRIGQAVSEQLHKGEVNG